MRSRWQCPKFIHLFLFVCLFILHLFTTKCCDSPQWQQFCSFIWTVFDKMNVITTNVACTRIIRIKVIARFRSISREIIYWAFITTNVIVMRSWITASINRGAGRECTLVTVAFLRHVIRFLPIICRQIPIIITGSTRGLFHNPNIRITYIHRTEI